MFVQNDCCTPFRNKARLFWLVPATAREGIAEELVDMIRSAGATWPQAEDLALRLVRLAHRDLAGS